MNAMTCLLYVGSLQLDYEADRQPGSSGALVSILFQEDHVRLVAIHHRHRTHKLLNRGAVLTPFLKEKAII